MSPDTDHHALAAHHGGLVLVCACGSRWDGHGRHSTAAAHYSDARYGTNLEQPADDEAEGDQS